ncbi:hypothetical protein BE15_34050 [Sorangium cellulosum]|uniref:Uncharacterized protein n=1 Tax=Sorangium cellulosum TaxID=56 RepID=A0A150QVR5_SORCE|nr:hypothetical protein BE15_34050 [Sorangium cellulosum]
MQEGDGHTCGYTRLTLKIDERDVDIDSGLERDTLARVTRKTSVTVHISLSRLGKHRSNVARAAATIAHEFVVHAMPFLSIISMIRSGATATALTKHWTSSKNGGLNSGDNQHYRFGAGLIPEFDVLINAMADQLRSNKDKGELRREADEDKALHQGRYPVRASYHTRE